VPVQFTQVVRGAGEQPSAFTRSPAAPGHHGQFLAGLELPGYWFRGPRPQLAVLPSAGMAQTAAGAGGGRILIQVPGPLRRALRCRSGSLASGASSRSVSWPARAKFSSLT